MNYIKYLADARLLNIIYHQGSVFPKKPAMVVVNNPNLIYTVYPRNFGDREILNSFFINQLRKDHTVNKDRATDAYRIDGETSVRISAEGEGESRARGKKLLHRLQRPRGRQGKENTAMALRFSLLKESLAAPRAILYI